MLVGLILGLMFVSPLVLVYVIFIRWCDRFEPEPWWLIGAAFIWGAFFATLFGGASSDVTQTIVAQVAGVAKDSDKMEAFGAVVLAPIFEEGFKGLGVGLLVLVSVLGLREVDGALDGAIYGGVIGLGFTLTEDILYVSDAYDKGGLRGFLNLVVIRTVFLGLSHCTFTACTGLGFGMAVEAKGRALKVIYPLAGFLLAMCIHALHNWIPAFLGDPGLVLMILFSWAVDIAFFVLLWTLVAGDRRIVIRELVQEVGRTIHPEELMLVSSYLTLSLRNWRLLFSRGFRTYRTRRKKQLALVELAFVKHRRRRGESNRDLDVRERGLREEIAVYNRAGVYIGQ